MTDAADRIDQLAEDYWQFHLRNHPSSAHILGHYEHAAEFERGTRADEDEEIAGLLDFADRADAVPEEGLDDQRRITRSVLASHGRNAAGLLGARLEELNPDPIFGLQVSLPIMTGMFGLPRPEVAEAMVDKYRGVARHYGELVERVREGAARGRFPAAFAVDSTVAQIDRLLDTPVADDPLLHTATPPEGLDTDAWRARLHNVVESHVRPAMAAYRDVLREEVLPHARPDERCGLRWLEDGDPAYAAALRYFTTTDRTPQEIHELGLEVVAQLADEYRTLGPEVVGTDDLQQIFEAMRTDPKLHFERGEQLVEASEVAMERAWQALPQWFEVLPKAPCAVQSTLSGAKAFYYPPASDGSRGGTFFVNVDDPTSWGTFELESMAFHEGIPGHHLQIAISSELEGIPEFRKHLRNSAYSEGWGLYTERLADEMGLYSGTVDRMGMLSADSMRACRLVVDTGLHALGWSREQAVQYMVDNSPLAEGVVRPEIDRYVVSPGQATSYMVGRVEIQRMRAEAERRQGEAFDIRAFHSAVLDSGSVPLDVLDEGVRTRLP